MVAPPPLEALIQTADIADRAFAITECIFDSVTQATILSGLGIRPQSPRSGSVPVEGRAASHAG